MTLDLFARPAPLATCPSCGRPLDWTAVQVHAAGDVRVPAEEWEYAECVCGMGYSRRPEREDA